VDQSRLDKQKKREKRKGCKLTLETARKETKAAQVYDVMKRKGDHGQHNAVARKEDDCNRLGEGKNATSARKEKGKA